MTRLPRPRGRHGLPRRVGRGGGLRVRRGRLHDRDDRLPGGRHRPELRGADRLLHGADGRQLRRRTRALRVAPRARPGGRHARGARAGVDGLAARARRRRALRDRHALARPPPARGGRDAGDRRRRRGCASTRRSTQVRAQPAMAGRALAAEVSTRRAVRLLRTRRGRGSRSSTTAASARSSNRLAWRARRSPSTRTTPTPTSSPRYDGVLLSNGPGDPEPLDGEVDDGRASCSAGCRCSGSASATSCSRSRPGTRRSSSRSATAARTTRCSSARPAACSSPSQNHGFAVAPSEEREATPRLALRRNRRGPRLPELARALRAVPSRGRPGPARRLAVPRRLGRGGGPCPGGLTSTRSA